VVKKQIDLLVEVQEKDRLLEKLKAQICRGPERIRNLEKNLQSLQEDMEANKTHIQDLKKAQRLYESDIEDGLAHVRKSRGKLMSIKNNREYRAVLKEIEEIEKENASKEDKVIGCLEEQERLGEALKGGEKDLAAMRETIAREKKVIEEELSRAEKELAHVTGDKQNLVQDIDSSLLAQYDRIKIRSGGVAVALVNNATCCGCHMSIPAQMYNELQRQDALQLCPHCQRIIYWKEVEPSVR